MSVEKKKLTVYFNEPPSNEFVDAFVTGGGIRASCEFCGRMHFENKESAGTWEDGELEELRQGAIDNPDMVIPRENVRTASINGKQFVEGCPCNALTPYEKIIWDYRREIAAYIAKRVKAIVEDALEDEGISDGLSDEVKREERRKHPMLAICKRCLKECAKSKVDDDGVCDACHAIEVIERDKKTAKELVDAGFEDDANVDADLPF